MTNKNIIKALSFIGIINALYLTWIHLSNAGQCVTGNCNAVLASTWSTFLTIPISVFGISLYTVLIYLNSNTKEIIEDRPWWTSFLSFFGVIISLYLTSIQITKISTICPFCLLSALLITIIFILSLKELKDTGPLNRLFSIKSLHFLSIYSLTKIGIIPLLLFFTFSYFNINKSGISPEKKASFANISYSIEEIDKKLSVPIIKAKKELYTLRLEFLETELVKFHANKEKVTTQDLFKSVLSKEKLTVSNDEIETFFEERKDQFQDKTLDEMRAPIKNYLQSMKEEPVRVKFIESLKQQYNFEYPFRDPSSLTVPKNKLSTTTKGPEDAPIHIVEFSDLECPYCKNVHESFKDLLDAFPDKIKITFRHFPLSMHSGAKQKAIASACANEQGKFWEYLDLIFKDQQTSLYPARQRQLTQQVGLNYSLLNQCINSGKGAKIVEKDIEIGKRLGIQGTPAIFVNNKVMKKAPSKAEIIKLLNQKS